MDAAYGNSLGEPYNIGLIEVTTATSEGKSKMRNGLRWLLYKLEQRVRELRMGSKNHENHSSPITGRQQRSLNRLQIPSDSQNTSPTKPSASDLISPLTAATESDGHAFINGSTGIGNGHSNGIPSSLSQQAIALQDDETTDHRSSGSSLQWMMAGPFSADGHTSETNGTRGGRKENGQAQGQGLAVGMGAGAGAGPEEGTTMDREKSSAAATSAETGQSRDTA